MRRLVQFYAAPLVALAALLNLGCEDGPAQTYSPAPSGAGNVWNGPSGTGGLGDGGAYVPGATENYDASFGGTNLNTLCTADEEKAIWNALFQQNVAVPGVAGGIDIAGGYSTAPEGHCTVGPCAGSSGYVPGQPWTYDESQETWTGTTVEDAEAILCQATANQVYYGETNAVGWGESLEFNAEYVVSSRQITDLLIEPGYLGSFTATATTTNGGSKVGDQWVMSFQNIQMTKNGSPVTLTWDTSDPNFVATTNEFYNAILDTYQPAFPREANCLASGNCQAVVFAGEEAIYYFPPVNIFMYFPPPNDAQPAPSIVELVDIGLLKLLPFGTSSNLLKLDAQGPTATVVDIASSTNTCVYHLGQQFSDFDSTCVQAHPASDPNQAKDNKTEEAKLFGGYTHSDEAYSFDLAGIDPQFVASSLAPTAVVADGQKPAATDLAYQFEIDQQDLGTTANDFTNNDTTQAKDWHGIGLVTLEWAETLQKYMHDNYGVTAAIGDTNCTKAMAAVFDGAGNVTGTFQNPAGEVCSGIEGIVTSAPVASAALPINALGPAALSIATASKLALGLKPGSWSSLVCFDGKGLDASGNPSGYANCIGGDTPFNGTAAGYFDTITDALTVAYQGNPAYATNPLPQDVTNRRFAFQQWIFALVKYLQSAGTATATIATIDANPVDENNLFLDSAGAGFDSAQYVFRNNVNASGTAPIVLSVTVELNGSNINDFSFDQWNFRGETLLYSVLQADPTTALPKAGDKLGAEPLFLSNMFGSSLLTTTFGTGTDPTNTAAGYGAALAAYAAGAITVDLTDYAPSFGQGPFNIAANGASPTASAMTVNPTDYEFIQSAMVSVPVWSRPYDPTSASAKDPLVSELLNYIPSSASVGFSVTIDGSREKFYNTNSTYFTGVSVNGTLDWEYTTIPGLTGPQLVVRAFESQNYLGQVFMCAEPNPTTAGVTDILGITMYEPAQTILDWISSHPNATADCGLVIQYSIYGNYADYIESNIYGVRVALNASYGGAVVTDLTVFDPNVIATLGS